VEYPYVLVGGSLYHVADGWRLELAGGVQCRPVQAQATASGGAGFSYQCSDGKWLKRGLRPGQVWYAEAAAASAGGASGGGASGSSASGGGASGSSASGGGAEAPAFLPVVRIWQ